MKVLFLVPYPSEGASNRVRVEQFIPYLKRHGVECVVRPFLNKRFFKIIYEPRRYIEKIFWFVLCTLNRICDPLRVYGCDVVFIHREAYPVFGPIFERVIHWMKKPIIFDFDDAIFLPNTSKVNSYIERFKRPDKVAEIIRMSRHVIAGNDYLKAYALKFNKNVTVIPSSVDTEKYIPKEKEPSGNIAIGWIGINTTKRFLYDIEDVLAELSAKYGNIVFKVVGASFHSAKLKNVINKKWLLDEEVADIQSFDIGVMPMPDNEWTRGKCAFKALLYMSCGVPTVSSAVGMNMEVVIDGADGFSAKDAEEWFKKLSILIDDRLLRRRMGELGRKKVLEKYSMERLAPVFCDVIMKASQK